MPKKLLYIKTYGCQMNVYDSERMADILAPLGYETVDTPKGADMVILNTCHIREKASEKVYSELGRYKSMKKKKTDAGEQMIVAVGGCVGQAEGAEIMKREPLVDMVFGPQSYHNLPEMLAKATRGQGQILDTDFPVEDKFDFLPKTTKQEGPSAFLAVQEGCDKFCTFCVVPYTRGAEYSRPVEKVLEEARRMIDGGVREIILLGQNVNAYHGDAVGGQTWGLAQLIRELADMDEMERIRYITSHPRDMQDDLIIAHGEVPQLMPYLHLPVQAGSDRTLKAMNRKHTADEYRDIIARVRKQRPDIALSSDFIVGFPGETDQDFEDTMQLISDIGYSLTYSFKYSPRPGTPGAGMDNQVPEEVKQERLGRLQTLLAQQSRDFNANCVWKNASRDV
jgi:tRNA-2-methylthio-N6-dimethylallyladenosine synthase